MITLWTEFLVGTVIAGANMVLVDFHPSPAQALVDGPQALKLEELPHFLEDVQKPTRSGWLWPTVTAIMKESLLLSFHKNNYLDPAVDMRQTLPQN